MANLDEQSIRRIAQAVFRSERGLRNPRHFRRRLRTPIDSVAPATVEQTFIGVTESVISAASWTASTATLGRGTVRLWPETGSYDPPRLYKSGTEYWYNIVPIEIPTATIVMATLWEGKKIVVVEECPP